MCIETTSVSCAVHSYAVYRASGEVDVRFVHCDAISMPLSLFQSCSMTVELQDI